MMNAPSLFDMFGFLLHGEDSFNAYWLCCFSYCIVYSLRSIDVWHYV